MGRYIPIAVVVAFIAALAFGATVLFSQEGPTEIPIDGLLVGAGPGQGVRSDALQGEVPAANLPSNLATDADLAGYATQEEVSHISAEDVGTDSALLVDQTFPFPNANEWYQTEPDRRLVAGTVYRITIGDDDAWFTTQEVTSNSNNVASGFRANVGNGHDITVNGRIFYLGANRSLSLNLGSNQTGSVHVTIAPFVPIALPTTAQLVPAGGTAGQVLKIDPDGSTRIWGADQTSGSSSGGLDQNAVDARVVAGTQKWARAGDVSTIDDDKMPALSLIHI